MRIIEEFIEGKVPNQDLCEDGIFKSAEFVAIIDGATAKSQVMYGPKSPGRIAMEKIMEALGNLDASLDAYEAVDFITSFIADWYKELGIYEHLRENHVECPTASAVIYNHKRKEIWQVGDCMALVDGEPFYNDKIVDEITTNARCLYLQMLVAEGKTVEELIENDIGRKFITPLLEKQGALQNNPNNPEYAYEVFDGFPVLKSGIKVIDVSKAKTVILASDGYPKLFGTLRESEDYLRYVLDKDPLCFTLNKGTKAFMRGNLSFDDRAYVKIEL